MILLGRKYRDKITGFTGIATGYVDYISGCNQALLAPRIGDKGEFIESQWLDVQRLELLEGIEISLDNEDTPGADKAAPKR